ncbi:MAG: rod shape-determining protein MreD [Acetivibrionales bacterium]|jgi:rod shape-determining protein MreD
MKIKVFIYTLCILLIMLLQSTILEYTEIYGVKPNLMIVFIICVAFLRGSTEGTIVGFFTGLLQDMLFGTLLGFYALLGMYLGLFVGMVNKKLYRENLFIIVFFTFISTMLYETCVFVLTSINTVISGQVSILFPFVKVILPEAIYNSLISVLVHIFVIKLNFRFEEMDRSARKY